jgi:DNA-binding LacI/PurR family transcriptional regulator
MTVPPPSQKPSIRPDRIARPALAEVAQRAGLSASTVSRVVRGSTPVGAELERTVREAIAATGYVPETGVPVVFMGKPFDVTGYRCVDADNAAGTAVDYLHAKGRRGIAMIAGIRDMRSGADRLAGYRRGLQQVGLAGGRAAHHRRRLHRDGGERAMAEPLGRSVPIDAVSPPRT